MFRHLLAGEVIVRVVGKGQGDDGQAGDGHGAQLGHAGHPVHFPLNGQGNTPLHLLRCQALGLGDDIHLHVLHIGKGLNGQVAHRIPAEDHQNYRRRQHEHPLGEGKSYETFQHHRPQLPPSSAFNRRAPAVTTRSPGFRPFST